MMKAIHLEAFTSSLTTLIPTSIPAPTPSKTDLLIHVTHASVTHVDLLYAQGLHQNNKRHTTPPFVLGTEFAGIILASPTTSCFPPGSRVFGTAPSGAFAETIAVPQDAVRLVPRQWSNAQACAVGVSGAVSLGALRAVGVAEGETVVVLGASGGVGVMACEVAKGMGARVLGVASGMDKMRVVSGLGVEEVVDYREDGWEMRIRELSHGGQGVDVVFDGVGAVESGIRCLRYRGRLVVVGFAGRGGKMEKVAANRILLKSAMVHGYRFGEDGRHDPQRVQDVWDGFMKLVDEGKIQPVVYNEEYHGLESVSRALKDVQERKVWGRAIIRIDEDAERALDAPRAML